MQLSKNIPAHKRTIKFEWCKKDFTTMNQRFRDIRANSKNPMDACFWCGHKFENGEMMALAHPVGKTNKTLCQSCADILLHEKGGDKRIKYYTTGQVAKELGFSKPTIRKWCDNGDLNCHRTLGKKGHRRISEEAVRGLKQTFFIGGRLKGVKRDPNK